MKSVNHISRLSIKGWFSLLAPLVFLSVANADPVLRFGVVPQFDARQIQTIWKPIVEEIETRTGLKVELVGSSSIPVFERQLMAGELDLAYMNPYHLLKANAAQGYEPIVRDVGRKLYGILVARKDRGITQLTDLQGKVLAFPAPNALGAALIPRAELSERYHINFESKYVRSHSSVYLNVVMGLADAGGGVQKTLDKQTDAIKSALQVIYKTTEIAPHPVAVHARVTNGIREKLMNALLDMGKSEEGKKLLAKVPMQKIGAAQLSDYAPLRSMGLDKYYVE